MPFMQSMITILQYSQTRISTKGDEVGGDGRGGGWTTRRVSVRDEEGVCACQQRPAQQATSTKLFQAGPAWARGRGGRGR
jgi:hypothetical protein